MSSLILFSFYLLFFIQAKDCEEKSQSANRQGCSNMNKAPCCCCSAKSLQSCPTLCDPIDSSPPGCPVLGILQARKLEWVAISFSNKAPQLALMKCFWRSNCYVCKFTETPRENLGVLSLNIMFALLRRLHHIMLVNSL